MPSLSLTTMTGRGAHWRSGRIGLLGPAALWAAAVVVSQLVAVVLEPAAVLEVAAAALGVEVDSVAAMGEGAEGVLPALVVAALAGVDMVAVTTLLSHPTTLPIMQPVG